MMCDIGKKRLVLVLSDELNRPVGDQFYMMGIFVGIS